MKAVCPVCSKLMSADNLGEICGSCRENYPPLPEVKQVAGKLMMEHVPLEILEAVARVRTHSINGKYPDPDNWKKADPQYYRGALIRHLVPYMKDPHSRDPESGLLHSDHIACNMAFLVALDKEVRDAETHDV